MTGEQLRQSPFNSVEEGRNNLVAALYAKGFSDAEVNGAIEYFKVCVEKCKLNIHPFEIYKACINIKEAHLSLNPMDKHLTFMAYVNDNGGNVKYEHAAIYNLAAVKHLIGLRGAVVSRVAVVYQGELFKVTANEVEHEYSFDLRTGDYKDIVAGYGFYNHGGVDGFAVVSKRDMDKRKGLSEEKGGKEKWKKWPEEMATLAIYKEILKRTGKTVTQTRHDTEF